MNPDELSKSDLNLLVALNALIDERSVSRAAERLQVSQPAMSRTLQRLRDLFQDPLFIRTPAGLDPTARCLALQQPVSLALDQLVRVLTPETLDPELLERTFSLAITDSIAAVLAPALVDKLEQLAPKVRLKLREYSGESVGLLTKGTIDFVAGIITDSIPVGVHGRALMHDRLSCLMRPGHPLAEKKELTLEDLLAYDHLKAWFRGINDSGTFDRQLKSLGIQRFIRMESPHLGAIIRTLQTTDSICLGLAGLVSVVGADQLHSVPVHADVSVRQIELNLLWDQRNHNDPASRWFRQLLVDTAAEINADIGPLG